jgi:hypothetical protein
LSSALVSVHASTNLPQRLLILNTRHATEHARSCRSGNTAEQKISNFNNTTHNTIWNKHSHNNWRLQCVPAIGARVRRHDEEAAAAAALVWRGDRFEGIITRTHTARIRLYFSQALPHLQPTTTPEKVEKKRKNSPIHPSVRPSAPADLSDLGARGVHRHAASDARSRLARSLAMPFGERFVGAVLLGRSVPLQHCADACALATCALLSVVGGNRGG